MAFLASSDGKALLVDLTANDSYFSHYEAESFENRRYRCQATAHSKDVAGVHECYCNTTNTIPYLYCEAIHAVEGHRLLAAYLAKMESSQQAEKL
jgi:hypothetical protein